MTKNTTENICDIESCKEKRSKWSDDEVNQLVKAVKQCGISWFDIAKKIPNRNPNQCAQKWKRLQGGRSRTNKFWSQEEDEKLAQLVDQIGKKWVLIAKRMKPRNSKQCRDRFTNNIDPNLNSDPFTQEEDSIIYQKYLLYGQKWSKISKELMGRSDNQVKNRFYSYIRTTYLQVQNPYYTKQSAQQAKKQLESAREEHLIKLVQQPKEEEEVYDDNMVEERTNEDNFSEYYNFSYQHTPIYFPYLNSGVALEF